MNNNISSVSSDIGNGPLVRLPYREKVSVQAMQVELVKLLREQLANATYDGEKCGQLAKQLTELAKQRLKASNTGSDRYKFVVQILIGERREQGLRTGSRCFWDAGTDCQASETFINDHIFCVATAFAVYMY